MFDPSSATTARRVNRAQGRLQSGTGSAVLYLLLVLLSGSLTPEATANAVDQDGSVSTEPLHLSKDAKTLVFNAELDVSISVFSNGYAERATVLFGYSNHTWQVQYCYSAPTNMQGNCIDCKLIPDGVRCFRSLGTPESIPTGAVRAASVLPIKFPLPEYTGSLACWLALCPNPELPLKGAGRMRKFAPSILLDHPENDCTYAAGYLESEQLFLAQLTITNNGKLLQPRGRWTAYPPPFNQGFLEWEYKVDITTNFGGITFPLSATLKRYTMKSNAHDCTDLIVDTEVKLSVTRFTPGRREPAFDAPGELMAIDQRPTGLPPGVSVNHTVTGDVWSSVSDPQMARLTKLYKQSVKREPPKRSRTLVLAALAATLILPGFLLLRRWKKQRN